MNTDPIRYVSIWSGWKGDGALVSAMFSGKRYFHVNHQQQIENRLLNTGIPVDITPGKPAVKNPQQK